MRVSARATVLQALADISGTPVDDIQGDQDIADLGLDSMDFWTILMEVEDATGAVVPAEVLEQIALLDRRLTVEELLAAVAEWDSGLGT